VPPSSSARCYCLFSKGVLFGDEGFSCRFPLLAGLFWHLGFTYSVEPYPHFGSVKELLFCLCFWFFFQILLFFFTSDPTIPPKFYVFCSGLFFYWLFFISLTSVYPASTFFLFLQFLFDSVVINQFILFFVFLILSFFLPVWSGLFFVFVRFFFFFFFSPPLFIVSGLIFSPVSFCGVPGRCRKTANLSFFFLVGVFGFVHFILTWFQFFPLCVSPLFEASGVNVKCVFGDFSFESRVVLSFFLYPPPFSVFSLICLFFGSRTAWFSVIRAFLSNSRVVHPIGLYLTHPRRHFFLFFTLPLWRLLSFHFWLKLAFVIRSQLQALSPPILFFNSFPGCWHFRVNFLATSLCTHFYQLNVPAAFLLWWLFYFS